MTNLTKISLMLSIVAGLLIFDYFNSKPIDNQMIKMPKIKISSNPVIQSAYEQCYNSTVTKYQKDNPTMPKDMMVMTLNTFPDICKSMFESSCKNNVHTSKQCQFIMKPYLL